MDDPTNGPVADLMAKIEAAFPSFCVDHGFTDNNSSRAAYYQFLLVTFVEEEPLSDDDDMELVGEILATRLYYAAKKYRKEFRARLNQ